MEGCRSRYDRTAVSNRNRGSGKKGVLGREDGNRRYAVRISRERREIDQEEIPSRIDLDGTVPIGIWP